MNSNSRGGRRERSLRVSGRPGGLGGGAAAREQLPAGGAGRARPGRWEAASAGWRLRGRGGRRRAAAGRQARPGQALPRALPAFEGAMGGALKKSSRDILLSVELIAIRYVFSVG